MPDRAAAGAPTIVTYSCWRCARRTFVVGAHEAFEGPTLVRATRSWNGSFEGLACCHGTDCPPQPVAGEVMHDSRAPILCWTFARVPVPAHLAAVLESSLALGGPDALSELGYEQMGWYPR